MTRLPQENTPALPQLKRPFINPALLVLLVAVLAIVGGGLVLRFVKIQEGRELLSWQNRLSLIADSRASDIEAWLDRQFKELGNVAGNPSLQIYLTEVMSQPATATPPSEDPAQMVFLRNLLSITADRLGFIDKASQEIKSIDADVRQPTGAGLAIIDNNGKILVSTAGLPAIDTQLAQKIDAAPKAQPALIDIYANDAGKNHIGFILPIYAIQSENPAADQPIGHLIAVKDVDEDLFKLLHHPGVTEKTLEAVLLRKEGSNVAYLSPQADGSANALALDTPGLDAAYAINAPDSFAVRKDAQSHTVLMTSRAIARSPWVMLLHIDRDQALGESDVWLRQIAYSLGFALLAVIGFIVAVWYYGTSRRVMLLSDETGRMAAKSAAQEKLLRVVADNQLEPIVIADQDNVARFANAKAAKAFHMDMEDVAGKDLIALMGNIAAQGYAEGNKMALARRTPYIRTWTSENGAQKNIIRSEHIPLDHIPLDSLPMPSRGVLIIDQDITEIVNEREHRMRILRQMIDMLVHMVDKRDPFAANHSACVALVARTVAVGLGLDAVHVETAETAGNLMNIGKIIVPSAMLTKPVALTADEIGSIRESLQSSIALLKNIEFGGPVVETLQQSQERFDGTGPLRLKGDDILITARIIAVANAFVGMISLRSYRQAISIEQAILNLLNGIDTQFDRRVVIALADYIENKNGREEILRLTTRGE